MQLLLILATAIASPAQATDPGAFIGPLRNCRTGSHYAGSRSIYRNKRLEPRTLAELPPANIYASVLRVGPDGCESPLIIRHNVGASRR